MRRQSPASALPGAPDDSKAPVRFGTFEINLATRTLTRNGKHVGADDRRIRMLKTLVTHPRTPLSRESLDGTRPRSRVRRLRPQHRCAGFRAFGDCWRKIRHPRYIQTVWGVGTSSSRRFPLGASAVS